VVKTEANIALISVVLGFILSIFTYTGGQLFQHKMEILKRNREKKETIYENFIKVLYKIFLAGDMTEENIKTDLTQINENCLPQLVVWCSKDVIKAYKDLFQFVNKTEFNKEKPSELEIKKEFLISFVNLLREIRKDLGYKEEYLTETDLSMFLKEG